MENLCLKSSTILSQKFQLLRLFVRFFHKIFNCYDFLCDFFTQRVASPKGAYTCDFHDMLAIRQVLEKIAPVQAEIRMCSRAFRVSKSLLHFINFYTTLDVDLLTSQAQRARSAVLYLALKREARSSELERARAQLERARAQLERARAQLERASAQRARARARLVSPAGNRIK